MATISAAMVKELRDKTDAGMMDCKKALLESDGDMDQAVDVLRKAGIAKAEKKSGRAVKEGKITSMTSSNIGVLLEILCETDFVAKNERFLAFLEETADKIAGGSGDGDISTATQEAEQENLTSMIATIGENMQIRRVVRWESQGACASYLHMGGKIGVLIDAEGVADEAVLNDICMHIAAFKPAFVNPDDIPGKVIDKEKEIAAGQVEGKPAEIIDKIVMGKLNKWYTEVCLMKQPWLRDDKQSVEKANPELKIKRFVRWEIGEEL